MALDNFSTRILTTLLLAPAVVGLIIYGGNIPFFVALQIFVLLGTYETIKILRAKGIVPNRFVAYFGALSIPAAFFFTNFTLFAFALFFVLFLSFFLRLVGNEPFTDIFHTLGGNLFICLYTPFLLGFLYLIYDVGYIWVIYLLIIVWLNDTGAYLTGSSIGKRPLISSVSAAKTVEGLIGGIVLSLIGGLIFSYLYLDLPLLLMIIIPLDVAAAAILGDLFESMLKRDAKLKDSGNIFPGHGGVLDRIDSIIFAGPVLYFYIYYLVI